MAAPGGPARYGMHTTPTLLSVVCLAVVALTAACASTPPLSMPAGEQTVTKPPAAGQGIDECLPQRAENAVANGALECQYFTSGSMTPASVPRDPGMSSGDYAIRFGSVGGRTLTTVRIPCASYAVTVSIATESITPDPGTLESSLGTCNFPWDQEQSRMKRYLEAPLQFAQRETGIVLHNPEWGITLFRTPYEAG